MQDLSQLNQLSYDPLIELLPQLTAQNTLLAHNTIRRVNGAGSSSHRLQANINKTAMTRVTSQNQVINSSRTFQGRWVSPVFYADNTYVGVQDLLLQNNDPIPYILQTQYNAALQQREIDFFNAAIGQAITGGETPTGPIANFLASNVIAVDQGNPGVPTGMTTEKLNQLNYLMKIQRMNLIGGQDVIWLAMSPKQHKDLLGQIFMTSGDFQNTKPLAPDGQSGVIPGYMNMRFLVSDDLPSALSINPAYDPTYELFIAWAESSIKCAEWQPLQSMVKQLTDAQFRPWMINTQYGDGYARVMDEKVFVGVTNPSWNA